VLGSAHANCPMLQRANSIALADNDSKAFEF
jgi:hypothetical protein